MAEQSNNHYNRFKGDKSFVEHFSSPVFILYPSSTEGGGGSWNNMGMTLDDLSHAHFGPG